MSEKIKTPVVEVSTPDNSALNGVSFRQVFNVKDFDEKKFTSALNIQPAVIVDPQIEELDESGFHMDPAALENLITRENGLESLFKAFLSDLVGADKSLTKLFRFAVHAYIKTGSLDAMNWVYGRLLRTGTSHINTFKRALKAYGFTYTGRKVTGAYSVVSENYELLGEFLLCQIRPTVPAKPKKIDQIKEDAKDKAFGRAFIKEAKEAESKSWKKVQDLTKSANNTDYTQDAREKMKMEIEFHKERAARAQLVTALMAAMEGVELSGVCIPDMVVLITSHLIAEGVIEHPAVK